MSDAIEKAEELLRSLRLDANAQNVAIIDAEGQVIAADLDGNIEDPPSFFAELREAPEREFDVVDETGEKHIKLEPFAGGRFTLFVMYDDHSTLGLVRIGIKKKREQFEQLLTQL
jgi:predicted regulator of Ras-like GTPase activity (Roadblock/LC7/MglB family)